MARRRSPDLAEVIRFPGRGRPRKAGREPVGIRTVDVGLEILDAVVKNGAAIGLSDLSRKTGVQPSKLHRYLVSLTRRGLLTQAAVTGLYDLGPYARHVGFSALNRFDEMGYIHQAITAFAAETAHALALYVWTELGPALVRLEMGPHYLPVSPRVGSVLPLCTSATGRVFLAYLPEAMTRPFVDKERNTARKGGFSIPNSETLRREIEKIRSSTIYETSDAIMPGVVIVAPLFDQHGGLLCTFSALAPRGALDERDKTRLSQDLERFVNSLSRQFRGT